MQIKTRQRIPHPSTLHTNQGYPIYLKGDQSILYKVKLIFSANITFPKNTRISVPFASEKNDFIEPLLNVEVINDNIRQLIMKNRYQLKNQCFYIYYPSNIRVDEKIYKMYNKNYENMIDEIPKNFKPFFARYITFQQGIGENSIFSQEAKVNESLSLVAKQILEKKINTIKNDILIQQAQYATSKSLHHIFLLKNKLGTIYQFLNLTESALQILKDVWFQMMSNFRIFLKMKEQKGIPARKLQQPLDLPKCPFIFFSMKDVLGYFEKADSTSYLRIVSYAFMKLYTLYIVSFKHLEAFNQLRFFIDYILTNVLVWVKKYIWDGQTMNMYDVCRNAWIAELIFLSLQISEKVKKAPLVTKEQEYYNAHVNICSRLRGSIQKIGFILYKVKSSQIVPTNINQEIKFFLFYLSQQSESISLNIDEKYVQSLTFFSADHASCDQITSELLLPYKIKMIFTDRHYFHQVYLQTLCIMYTSLKKSPMYKKLAISLKLSFCRAVMMFGRAELKESFMPTNQTKWEQFQLVESLHCCYFLIKQNKQEQRYSQIKELLSNNILNKSMQWEKFYSYISQNHYKSMKMGEIKHISIRKEEDGYYITFQLEDDKICNVYREESSHICVQIEQITSPQFIPSLVLQNIKIKENKLEGRIYANFDHPLIFRVSKLVLKEKKISFCFELSLSNAKTLKINTQTIHKKETNYVYYGVWSPIHLALTNKKNKISSIKLDSQENKISDYYKYDSQTQQLLIYLKQEQKHEEEEGKIGVIIGMETKNISYTLKQSIRVEYRNPFKITHSFVNSIEQHHIANISDIPFSISEGENVWEFLPEEEVNIQRNIAKVSPIPSQLYTEIQLHSPSILKHHEKPQTFKLSLGGIKTSNVFQKITIESEEVGEIEIENVGEGYELIGKIKGNVEYENGRRINLWILPVRSGSLLLPTLYINKKKGIWKDSLILEVN